MALVLSMCQLNCQKSNVVMGVLGKYMCENNINVAMIQEPYVVNGTVAGLPSCFKIAQSSRCENGSIRSAVVVNGMYETLTVNECVSELGVCLWLKGRAVEMYVVSVYCTFGEDLEPYLEYMRKVTTVCGNVCMIAGMDANACSPMWFSKGGRSGRISDAHGVLLEEWIISNGLSVLNEPSEWYTFSGGQGESDIDVTLVNESAEVYSFEWRIDPAGNVSDHNVILLDVHGLESLNINENVGKRWITSGADWDKYMRKLRMEICEYDEFENGSLEEKVDLITRCVSEVNDECLRPVRKNNMVKVKWWTGELDHKRLDVRRLRKVYQVARKTGLNVETIREEYRVQVNEYKKEIKKAKCSHWREFVRDCGNRDVWGPVYKLCRGRKKTTGISSMKVGYEYTKNWGDSVRVLLDAFFPPMVGEANQPRMNDASVPEFTNEEIYEAVYKTRVRRAPGLDGVNGEMMRRVWNALPEYVSRLFNQCLREENFPNVWKTGDLVVLLKSPDKVRTDPGSYRPICLLPVMGKVLERMMVNRLNEKLTNEESSGCQYGFTKGRSTEDAWLRVKEVVNEADKKYVLGVFVDFRGAFDNLTWSRVTQKLAEVGCAEVGLWTSYFRDRKVCVRGVNEVVWKNVERGCPQGSIGGPAVWNMMIEELLVVLNRCECSVVAYADDLLIVVDGDSRREIESKATDCLRYVTAWGEYVGVEVSSTKTECILLRGTLSENRPPNVRLKENAVRYAECVKYLGLTIGQRMDFKPHIMRMREKLRAVVGMLSRVLRKEWGLGKRAVKAWYKGVFVACMSYGSCVWIDVLGYEYARTLLIRAQRVVLNACLNVCRTVSTDAMQVLMGELPWDLEVARKDTLYRIKRGIPFIDGSYISREEVSGMSVTECKIYVKEKMFDVWQNRWNVSENGRTTHRFIRDVRFSGMCNGFSPTLRLGYLLTGHGSLNEYLFKRRLSEVSECLCGASVESVEHLIVDCVIYEDMRDLDSCGIKVNEDGSMDASEALSTRERYDCLSTFAHEMFGRRYMLMNADE